MPSRIVPGSPMPYLPRARGLPAPSVDGGFSLPIPGPPPRSRHPAPGAPTPVRAARDDAASSVPPRPTLADRGGDRVWLRVRVNVLRGCCRHTCETPAPPIAQPTRTSPRKTLTRTLWLHALRQRWYVFDTLSWALGRFRCCSSG